MTVRYPTGVLHSFFIKNLFYNKMNFKVFLFSCDDIWTTNRFANDSSCFHNYVVYAQLLLK